MGLYQQIFDRVLTKVDPERAHHAAASAITLAGTPLLAPVVRCMLGRGRAGYRAEVFGRQIASPLGIAAGFDKNATMATGLAAMGFGFVEVGTVTAHGQVGNDRPRLFRIPEQRALRNRMGFNNDGADQVALRLAKLRRGGAGKRVVLGVNIGKSRITPAAEAVADYEYSAKRLAPFADYLVVNVSSPNTPGLRDLQAVSSLRPIVHAVQKTANYAAARHVPVLVKIAPDLADEDIDHVARLVTDEDLAGVVAVNTTIGHDFGPGGVSGPILRERGLAVVTQLRAALGAQKVIIGVGGISTGEDLRAYLEAGASLAQGYTGFIYGGPTWPVRTGRAVI